MPHRFTAPDAHVDAQAAALHDQAVRLACALSAVIKTHHQTEGCDVYMTLGVMLGLYRDFARFHGLTSAAMCSLLAAAEHMSREAVTDAARDPGATPPTPTATPAANSGLH